MGAHVYKRPESNFESFITALLRICSCLVYFVHDYSVQASKLSW
jgi:hypothetical protein